MDAQNRTTAIGRLSGALKKQSVLKLSMRLYLLGIAAAALVLLISFVLREKNRAELQLQQTPVELPQQAENELALLCHAREQLVQQTNSHASMLARMRPEILNQTFSRLLHGDAFDPTETQALLSDLGCI